MKKPTHNPHTHTFLDRLLVEGCTVHHHVFLPKSMLHITVQYNYTIRFTVCEVYIFMAYPCVSLVISNISNGSYQLLWKLIKQTCNGMS